MVLETLKDFLITTGLIFQFPWNQQKLKATIANGFLAFNIYNRDNANSIFFRENSETLKNEAIQLSIFGIVPSVTYNFNF